MLLTQNIARLNEFIVNIIKTVIFNIINYCHRLIYNIAGAQAIITIFFFCFFISIIIPDAVSVVITLIIRIVFSFIDRKGNFTFPFVIIVNRT